MRARAYIVALVLLTVGAFAAEAAKTVDTVGDKEAKEKTDDKAAVVLDGRIDPKTPPETKLKPIDVPEGGKVMILELKDTFDPILLYHFRRGFKAVEEDDSFVAVVIDMNTPGGRVDVLKEVTAFINAARVPVLLYVEDMAISAGAILSFATQEIVMKDGSHIGAAAPVIMGGGGVQEMPDSYKEKMISFVKSSARALAQKNGYRSAIAEAMIDQDVEVRIGDRVISPKGKLLTLTAREAVEIMPDGMPLHAHGLAPTLNDYLKMKGLDKAEKVILSTTGAERLARFITMIIPLLMVGGFICASIEAKTPGFGFFGITALLCFATMLFGHHIAGASGMEGVLIFLIGVILLVLEIFVIPGFGVAGVLGIIGIIVGTVWMMIPYIPKPTKEFSNPWADFATDDLNRALIYMIITFVCGGFGLWLISRIFPHTPLFNRLVLAGSESSDAGFDGTDEKEHLSLVGKTGVAKSVLRPSGIATIDGKRVDVVTQGAFIEAGTPIKVKEVRGVRVVVIADEDAHPGAGDASETE